MRTTRYSTRLLVSALVLGLAVPVFAKGKGGGSGGGSNPTCTLPPTSVFQEIYYQCDNEIQITWAAPACSGITKYALEVTVTFVPPGGPTDCGDPAYVQTFSFTSPDATPQIVIPFSSLDVFGPIEFETCGPPSVRVKALTAPTGKVRGSQNNPFSTPSTDYEFGCI